MNRSKGISACSSIAVQADCIGPTRSKQPGSEITEARGQLTQLRKATEIKTKTLGEQCSSHDQKRIYIYLLAFYQPTRTRYVRSSHDQSNNQYSHYYTRTLETTQTHHSNPTTMSAPSSIPKKAEVSFASNRSASHPAHCFSISYHTS